MESHFFTKIGLTVRCLHCGKKYYIDFKSRPTHCPKCKKPIKNDYTILEEHYEKG